MKTWAALFCLLAIAFGGNAFAQPLAGTAAAEAAAAVADGDRWPKLAELDGATYTVYQPQLDSWDSYNLTAHAAVSVLAPGSQAPTFGVLNLTAKTRVDRLARTVYFTDTNVQKANFPSKPDWSSSYQQAFQALFVKGPFTVSLDRMEAALAAMNAQNTAGSVAVRNPVPQIVFSPTPAVLLTVDGEPAWRPVDGTSYQRVINTRPLLLRDASGSVYFHLFDGFMRAPGLAGPWTVASAVPPELARVASDLAARGAVDLMEGPADEQTGRKPSLASGAPGVIVVTKPTELIVTEGKPDLVTLPGTDLLYAKNTDANVFVALADQQTYVLVSGRWFRAPGLNGPWSYVAAKDLPAAFARIPDDSPKENVKAAIPGTAQAKEALIATQIPQTAHVDRASATFAPQLSGAPDLRPIEGTKLRYVANSPDPLIALPGGSWFALRKAVWFTAQSLQGPWSVATSVPADIYAIPPSSPVYYATYVRIYDETPTTVTVGYLPGYMGSYVADGVVVYGTGYAYPSYVGSAVWYGAPVTYGYAAGIAWTPWTGWAYGFGMGWAYGAAWGAAAAWGWGAAPYWGAYAGAAWGAGGAYGAWGPGGWAASSGNVYHQWGNTSAVTHSSAGYNAWTGNAWSGQAGHSYNSQTGRISAGQRGTVENVYSGNYASGTRGATYNPTTGVSASGARGTVGNAYTGQSTNVSHANVSGPGGNDMRTATVGNDHYADVNGNVYRNTGSGWEQHNSNGSWSSASSEGARSASSEQEAREAGERRSSAASYGGGDRSYGSGFRGSGSEPQGHGGFERGGGGGYGGGGFRGGGGGGRRR